VEGLALLGLLGLAAMIPAALWLVHRNASQSFGRETREERDRRQEVARDPSRRFDRARLKARREELVNLVHVTRRERELTKEESQETRDGLLKLLADAGSLNLKGKKGQLLIRHDGALPTSTLATFDQGRELKCELRGLGTHYDLALRVELKRASQVHLRLRHEDALTEHQREHGSEHQVGVEDFDNTFWIESQGWAGVEPLAEYDEARAAVEKIFTIPGVTTLTVMRGRMRVDGEIDAETPRARLVSLVGAIRLLARIYEGDPPVSLKLAARAVEVDAVRRCPYCRDDLGDPAHAEVTCEGCGTCQHLECHQENKGCPVLGCGVTSTQPVRT
jgi:hypothetical protein